MRQAHAGVGLAAKRVTRLGEEWVTRLRGIARR